MTGTAGPSGNHAGRRFRAPTVRDSALAVVGLLNLAVGGPSVFPSLPPGMPGPARGWELNEEQTDQHRRGTSIFVRRNDRYPMLDAFDFLDSHESRARCNQATTVPQTLALLNSRLAAKWARSWAARSKTHGFSSFWVGRKPTGADQSGETTASSRSRLRLGRRPMGTPLRKNRGHSLTVTIRVRCARRCRFREGLRRVPAVADSVFRAWLFSCQAPRVLSLFAPRPLKHSHCAGMSKPSI